MRVLTIEELELLAPPEWLIPDLLPKHALAQLSGPSGGNKTFEAIALCCKLAAQGRRCVYLAAEGQSGIASRIRAWEKYFGGTVGSSLLVIPDAAYLTRRESVVTLTKALYQFAPLDLLVIDTFARSMAGADENATKDVTLAVENLTLPRKHSGDPTTMLITHWGWEGSRQRGSSALYGACDTVLYMKPIPLRTQPAADSDDDEDLLIEDAPSRTPFSTLWVEKQKDGPDQLVYGRYERIPVDGTASCVLVPYQPKKKTPPPSKSNGHSKVTPSNVTAFRKMR